MTEQAARRIIELQIDQIFLSLDGATKQTYEQIRVGANFDKVISNTRRLIQIKREMRRAAPGSQNQYGCLLNQLPRVARHRRAGAVTWVSAWFNSSMSLRSTTRQSLDTESVRRDVQETFAETLQRARSAWCASQDRAF